MKFNKITLATALFASLLTSVSAYGKDDKSKPHGHSKFIKHEQQTKHSQYFKGHKNTKNCPPEKAKKLQSFNRISTFSACQQLDINCDTDFETAAEIVAASKDGRTLIYTDSPMHQVGFVNISNPKSPAPMGTLPVGGEPTSVAVSGNYALVGVNSSADFVRVAGELAVINIANKTLVRSIDLGGQPDSVTVSPDGKYAVVAIENERDEDLGDGAPPQIPAGYVVVVKLNGEPAAWASQRIDLTGLADLYPGDPEPEYVDINGNNIAVVTLQENNHIVLLDLTKGVVLKHFSAGTVDLTHIDTAEESPALISLTGHLHGVLREPDGVAWINNRYFATANEGDLDGGSRSFSIFNLAGEVVYDSGNTLDQLAVRLGHYPDSRSKNKGNEPENVEVGIYGGNRYLFVASERSSLVFVYDVNNPLKPVYKQTLPAAKAPEGVLAIPHRNLLISASEEDSREDGLRAGLNVYKYGKTKVTYPMLASKNRDEGTPIPWSALSGLVADNYHENILYAVDDSYFQQNRIFKIDTSKRPAAITKEIKIVDANDVFASQPVVALADVSVGDDNSTRLLVFDEVDLANAINGDKSINIDPEGIALAGDGGFWVASEGAGTVGDAARPINSLNWIFKTDRDGVIEKVFSLPAALNNMQVRFGFEGVTEYQGKVYVAFQRKWTRDAHPRIGVLNPADGSWSFFFYPLDVVESPNGGWVGLSDITSLGDGRFLVIERDNQAGPDARIKRLYQFDLNGLSSGATVSKTLVRDLMSDLNATGGLVPEKIEGLAVTRKGKVFIVNDNDGVEDNSGETQLINLGKLF